MDGHQLELFGGQQFGTAGPAGATAYACGNATDLPLWRQRLEQHPELASSLGSRQGDAAALYLAEQLPGLLLGQLPEQMDAAVLHMGWTHPAWPELRRRIEARWGAKGLAKAVKLLHKRIESRWG